MNTSNNENEQLPVNGAAGDEMPEGAIAPKVEMIDTPQAPAPDVDLNESVVWSPDRSPSENTVQEFEMFSALDRELDLQNRDVMLHLPSDDIDIVQAALNARPNIEIEKTREGAEWLKTIEGSELARPFRNSFKRTMKRKGAAWRQGVMSEKGRLNAGNMTFKDQGPNLTGERALMRVRALTGMGGVIRIPLWHSGFWISIKAPTDGAMMELFRRLGEEKITLGRATYGMAFGNMSVFYASHLVDTILSHVYDSSLHPSIEQSIRSRIDALDIPVMVWGLACLVWPGGFPYARSVLNPKNGEKVIREKINIGRALWTDTSALTPWQVSHMANFHGNTMTAEMLDRYKAEFAKGKTSKVKLAENVSVTLRHASVDQYLNSGNKWVNGIVHLVDQAFSRPPNDAVRDAYIMDQGKATMMRQYGHLVESINLGAGDTNDEMITDPETIESTLDVLSANDEIRTAFFKGTQEFLEDAVISIIATPVTEDEERGTLPRFPHLLPIDVLSVFFILLVQKIPQIQNR